MNAKAGQQSALIEQLAAIARRLDAMPHRERSSFMDAQAETIGVSKNTLYGWLKTKVGWDSGRKRRADAGTTSVPAETLSMVGGMQKSAIRKNGKLLLPTTVASSIVQNNGIEVPVSNAHLNRLMRQRRISANQQRIATPHVNMRSEHPNHVHQVDPSLCVLYYLNGRQHMMEADQFYKNKLENYAKVKLKIWRYVLTDHASAYIVPWYVEAAGESPENLFEFLMFAWSKRGDRDFHGVPRLLIWDKGSANTAAVIKNLLAPLEVEHIAHTKGNARAKGSVEGGNNLVEIQFESRLKFSPVESVAELNDAGLAWANAYNANCIPHQDTRLRRAGLAQPMARSDLWHLITAEQLRLLPDIEICRQLLRGAAVTRKVRGDMTIPFKHPQADRSLVYSLRGCDAVNVGDEVTVEPLVYGESAIVVSVPRYDGETLQHKVEPVSNYDQFGRSMDAPKFGESFQAQPDTEQVKAGKALDRVAYGDLPEQELTKAKDKAVPFGGRLDTHAHLKEVELPTYLPRKGTEIDAGKRFDEKPMSHIAAAKLLKAELGEGYGQFHLTYLKQHFPEGITTTDLEALVAQFKQTNVTPLARSSYE